MWIPGENSLDSTYWDKVKNKPGIVRLLDAGRITVEPGEASPLVRVVEQDGKKVVVATSQTTPKRPSAAPTQQQGIAAQPEATAIAMVNKETNHETLIRWYESESRAAVLSAIQARGLLLEAAAAQADKG
jgi:hypothetical protein